MRSSTGSEGAGSGVWGRAGRESLGRAFLSWVWQKPREFRTPALGRVWSSVGVNLLLDRGVPAFWRWDGYLAFGGNEKSLRALTKAECYNSKQTSEMNYSVIFFSLALAVYQAEAYPPMLNQSRPWVGFTFPLACWIVCGSTARTALGPE